MSVFFDQYDLEFELSGELQVIMTDLETFTSGMRTLDDKLIDIYEKYININLSCDKLYGILGANLAIGTILSLIPGKYIFYF